MPDPVKRISARFLRRVAEAIPDEEVPLNRFLDLVPLVLAYSAYLSYLERTGADDQVGLTAKGSTLIKRYFPQLQSGVQYHISPLGERPDAGPLRVPLRAALRAGAPAAVARRQATLFTFLFPWLRKRGPIFTSMFTGRAAKMARDMAIAVTADTPADLVHALTTVAPISGLTAPRKWIRAVAEVMGVAPSNVEQVMADAAVARSLGDKLAEIEAQQAATNDPFKVQELNLKKKELLEKIQEVADESPSEGAVLAAAAATQPTTEQVTEIGKRLGHTPDQEQAMMVQGRAIIAAGAGSGKTRVLASKVAYHINELGAAPSSILATTFTQKASAELIKRVRDYGGIIEDRAEGFGTTHSIAGKFLNKKAVAFRRPAYIGKKEGWKQNVLIRLAMEQVQMPGGGNVPDPPHQSQGLWDNVKPRVEEGLAEYQNILRRAIGYFQWAAKTFGPQRGAEYANMTPFLQEVVRRNPSDLEQWEKDQINQALSMLRGKGKTNYRVGAKGKRNKLEDYVYHKQPARRWFNLGRMLTRQNNDGSEQAVPIGEFKNAISIMKGKGLSPSEIWHGEGPYPPQSDHAAVYAAYEWLKGDNGEPAFAGSGDMDDILIDTVGALATSPNLRRQMQQQYKVLLIDEAQDLNRVQHLMFGLIAGHLDPDTLEPRTDGAMTADTFCLIGDDKQAIYEFRGADPEEFIDKSDLVEGGDEFQTKILEMNFRSARAIVESANRLIAHNKRQVPMTCTANVDRNGEGAVVARTCADTEDAAASVANEIEELIEAAQPGAESYKDFGVAVRSNAEAYHYGLEMLKRGIPFKSNASFFNDPNTKALIGWLTIVEKGLDGPSDAIEEALVDCVRAPYSRLGKAFFNGLQQQATGPWARWLVDGGWRQVYQGNKMDDVVHHFTNNLLIASKLSGSPEGVLEKLLVLVGLDGNTLQQSLVQSVEENDDVMAELSAEAEGGTVTSEQIIERAMAPIEPLQGLMKGRDELDGAMDFVRRLKNVNKRISSKDTDKEIDRDAVTIGTMHSWKGLEVPTMYVPTVGSKFPRAGQDGIAKDTPDLHSERRLAYVAITRAEQRCVLLDIPHPKFGTHSQFLTEACVPVEGLPAGTEAAPKQAGSAWNDSALVAQPECDLSWMNKELIDEDEVSQ